LKDGGFRWLNKLPTTLNFSSEQQVLVGLPDFCISN